MSLKYPINRPAFPNTRSRFPFNRNRSESILLNYSIWIWIAAIIYNNFSRRTPVRSRFIEINPICPVKQSNYKRNIYMHNNNKKKTDNNKKHSVPRIHLILSIRVRSETKTIRVVVEQDKNCG